MLIVFGMDEKISLVIEDILYIKKTTQRTGKQFIICSRGLNASAISHSASREYNLWDNNQLLS